jgi:hypothetical protein
MRGIIGLGGYPYNVANRHGGDAQLHRFILILARGQKISVNKSTLAFSPIPGATKSAGQRQNSRVRQ